MATDTKDKATPKPNSQEFLCQDLLSVVLGKNLSSTGDYDAIFDLMKFLLGHRVTRTNYTRALPVCKAAILRQHPKLEKYEDAQWERLDRWMRDTLREIGSDSLKLQRLSEEDRDAFREAEDDWAERIAPPKKAKTPKNISGQIFTGFAHDSDD